jgi:hypothetical protein
MYVPARQPKMEWSGDEFSEKGNLMPDVVAKKRSKSLS